MGHAASGSAPSGTVLQSPLPTPFLAAEQARQLPVHEDSQQTPSTQNPLAHCPPAAQAWPWASTQAPEPLQDPLAHSSSGSVFARTGAHVPEAAFVFADEHA